MTPILTLTSVAAFWAMVRGGITGEHGLRTDGVAGDGAALAGLVGLLFLYNAIMWPLHRRTVRRTTGCGPDHARYEAFDGVASTLLGVAIVWVALPRARHPGVAAAPPGCVAQRRGVVQVVMASVVPARVGKKRTRGGLFTTDPLVLNCDRGTGR